MSELGNNNSQSNDILLEELSQICRSDSLSEDGLRAIIEEHGVAPNSSIDPNKNIFFIAACSNERVTEGILRYLLEYFPNAARYRYADDQYDGEFALHCIYHNKNVTLGMVQLLIDAFPKYIRHEDHGGLPLHELCLNKNLNEEVKVGVLKLFLERYPESVRHATKNGMLPIHFASMTQSPEFCRILIGEYPGSEKMVDDDGMLPFHYACQYNTVTTAKYFYQLYPESINVENNNGLYPIRCAIIWGLKNRSNPKHGIEVVRFLLDCNPDVLSSTGQTPLHIACNSTQVTLKIVQLLIDAFPEPVRHEDNKGCMPIHLLCCNKKLNDEIGLEILKLLLKSYPESDNDPNINNYEFFHNACRNRSVTEGILRYLLKHFPNAARCTGILGELPLHNICLNKNVTLGMVQLLIDAFPDSVRHENNNGSMPLHCLCLNKNLDEDGGLKILELLITRYPESVRHAAGDGDLPIHAAAGDQSPEFCRILIEAYPGSERINNNYGQLPFLAACRCNTFATVKYLYRLYPESINVADNHSAHPIHYVIWGLKDRSIPKEGIEVVKFLVDCSPAAIRSTGQTPLHIICINNNVTLKIVQLLIDAFPDFLHHEDNIGLVPLHLLCANKNLDDKEGGLKILKLLLEKCPESVRHANENGMLPIHFAARYQSPEFCRKLIEAYPGSEQLTHDVSLLPFHAACRNNTVATAKYFYQLYPECINVTGYNGRYPIHYAIMGLKYREINLEIGIEMVRFLLDCDPNVALQMRRGKLPLYWVCKQATNETPKLNAHLRVLQILYDAHPEAMESNEVTSNVGSFCQEVQTFINTQLTYARQVRGRTVRQMKTRDANGQVPLHRALRDNVTLGSVKLLVKRNPSAITCTDNNGALPLHVACQHHESVSVVEYLVGLDSDTLTIVDREGNTALHHACRGAKYDTIALLLRGYGVASVSQGNAHNMLPIHLLLENNVVRDREDTKYVESIYRLLRAYPETLMHCTELQGCLSQNRKKRKIDEV
jgi:ankyrin repeat protein